ncbi:MAG: hypothetical protein EOP45_05440 [Sphingobacteriaceae bacterium]|nr:MAG: hypothetical protein EOP45_05440 [Sphingobacteriaceae bacterium]
MRPKPSLSKNFVFGVPKQSFGSQTPYKACTCKNRVFARFVSFVRLANALQSFALYGLQTPYKASLCMARSLARSFAASGLQTKGLHEVFHSNHSQALFKPCEKAL